MIPVGVHRSYVSYILVMSRVAGHTRRLGTRPGFFYDSGRPGSDGVWPGKSWVTRESISRAGLSPSKKKFGQKMIFWSKTFFLVKKKKVFFDFFGKIFFDARAYAHAHMRVHGQKKFFWSKTFFWWFFFFFFFFFEKKKLVKKFFW